MERPQLAAMLHFVREGAVVLCHSIDRLGRNLDDLRKLVSAPALPGPGLTRSTARERRFAGSGVNGNERVRYAPTE